MKHTVTSIQGKATRHQLFCIAIIVVLYLRHPGISNYDCHYMESLSLCESSEELCQHTTLHSTVHVQRFSFVQKIIENILLINFSFSFLKSVIIFYVVSGQIDQVLMKIKRTQHVN